MAYSDRKRGPNNRFVTDEDEANEERVRLVIEAAWNCELKKFGKLCAIDFYALREGRMKALIETKFRDHESGRFETVFLNVRKWGNLREWARAMGVPAFFVVGFTDVTLYIDIDAVDARQFRMGGTAKIVKSHTDIEPVILVPISDMRVLRSA